MRKIFAILIMFTILAGSVPLFAAEGGMKGPSKRAYIRANKQAIFHRVSDWAATIGKSEKEKAEIVRKRCIHRARKKAAKKRVEIEGKAKRGKIRRQLKIEKAKRDAQIADEKARGKKAK